MNTTASISPLALGGESKLNFEEISAIAHELSKLLIVDRRWLKLKAAAQYSMIGKDRLKTLAVEKKIIGYQDPDSTRGDWIFDKESIDNYRLSIIAKNKKKALSILNSL